MLELQHKVKFWQEKAQARNSTLKEKNLQIENLKKKLSNQNKMIKMMKEQKEEVLVQHERDEIKKDFEQTKFRESINILTDEVTKIKEENKDLKKEISIWRVRMATKESEGRDDKNIYLQLEAENRNLRNIIDQLKRKHNDKSPLSSSNKVPFPLIPIDSWGHSV